MVDWLTSYPLLQKKIEKSFLVLAKRGRNIIFDIHLHNPTYSYTQRKAPFSNDKPLTGRDKKP